LIQIAITEQNIKLPNKVILIFRDTSASKSATSTSCILSISLITNYK